MRVALGRRRRASRSCGTSLLPPSTNMKLTTSGTSFSRATQFLKLSVMQRQTATTTHPASANTWTSSVTSRWDVIPLHRVQLQGETLCHYIECNFKVRRYAITSSVTSRWDVMPLHRVQLQGKTLCHCIDCNFKVRRNAIYILFHN